MSLNILSPDVLADVFGGMERGHDGVPVTSAWHELVMQALLSCSATA